MSLDSESSRKPQWMLWDHVYGVYLWVEILVGDVGDGAPVLVQTSRGVCFSEGFDQMYVLSERLLEQPPRVA